MIKLPLVDWTRFTIMTSARWCNEGAQCRKRLTNIVAMHIIGKTTKRVVYLTDNSEHNILTGKNGISASLGYSIGKTNWYLKTYINKLLKEGGFTITSEQWLVLKVVSTNPGLSQTEIAEQCMKDKTNITRILDLLEKKGYLIRGRDDADRRMYRINITDQGTQVINAVIPLTQKTDEICAEVLQDEEIKLLVALLEKVCGNVKKNL